jgi:hypothetical protein
VYLPAVDDGMIAVHLPSVYDVEMMPYPHLDVILECLEPLSMFRGLGPKQLRFRDIAMEGEKEKMALVALELMCGALVPIDPLALPLKQRDVKHASMETLIAKGFLAMDEMPWEVDVAETLPADKEEETVLLTNPEAVFTEAYQHLRLTTSEWMAMTKEGRHVKKQLETLRQAIGRLPLFELRKRADLLLMPFVQQWIHVGPLKSETSLLRRDCLQIKKEEDCGGACSWSEGRCLIHTSKIARAKNPMFVLTARLVDELLRTHGEARQVLDRHVPRLRAPRGIVQGDQHLIVATDGDTSKLFQELGLYGRIPGKYTRGLVYPEEMGEEDVGREKTNMGIPLTWRGIKKATWHADVSRDPFLQKALFWSSLLRAPWDEIKDLVDPVHRFSILATRAHVNILTTKQTTEGYKLVDWYTVEDKPRMFVLLDPLYMPLQHVSGAFAIPEADLPEAIHAWLDTAAPVSPGPVSDVPLPQDKPLRGLLNDGNKCYWNSLVQMMRTIPEVRNAILGFDADAIIDKQIPNNAFSREVFHRMILELQALFQAIGTEGKAYSALPHYKVLLDVLFPGVSYTEQQSAEEILQRLFLNVVEYLLPTSPFALQLTTTKECLYPSPPRTPTTDKATSVQIPLRKDMQASLDAFQEDDFWRLALIRLVGANKLEKHNLASQYASVYRIIE